jgi:stearoyl-CoA desaturase (delta-9 desaturase)
LKGEEPFNLFGIFWVLLSPLLALYGLFVTPYHLNTIIFTAIFYFWAAVSLTGGYHRLFSHKTYSVNSFWKGVILGLSSSVMQGTVIVWARNHRAHHRYMDTEKDPYDATKGFWWSHEGWAIQQHRPENMSEIDISDLTSDPVVMFSHNYYGLLAVTTGVIFPTLFCGYFWGDYAGGFWLGGIVRIVVFLQCTFLINSLAHYTGHKDYNENITPVDNWLANLLTMGEGYHNFHHAFPYDYRGTDVLGRFDPARWIIDVMKALGIAKDVKRFPDELIEYVKLETLQRKIAKRSARLSPAPPASELPCMTSQDVKRRAQEGACLIIVEGLVHDVTKFLPEHPGGEAIIRAYFGKDATSAFYGNLVQHSTLARTVLASTTIAKIKDQ